MRKCEPARAPGAAARCVRCPPHACSLISLGSWCWRCSCRSASPATFSASTVAYYFGVFATAWDLLFGFAGEVNFGPTFLIGVGAYTAGILENLWSAADLALPRRRRARRRGRRRGAGAAGVARARPLFRADHARRRADAAELHRRRRRADRRRDRPHRARRDFDQRQGELRDRTVVHGREAARSCSRWRALPWD